MAVLGPLSPARAWTIAAMLLAFTAALAFSLWQGAAVMPPWLD